ncbi:hypothetical protein L4D21_05490 [Photobacterium profundum]|uniref:hypothetical protein n=1 Tax=Photobacterium profundum TaxID=74109 RepID=UPI003D0A49FF
MVQVKKRKEQKKITKAEAHYFAEIGNSLARRVGTISFFKEEDTSPLLHTEIGQRELREVLND